MRSREFWDQLIIWGLGTRMRGKRRKGKGRKGKRKKGKLLLPITHYPLPITPCPDNLVI
ncbi:formate hydrogenlyase maturation protein HycH [Tolypothrix sp. PCC 7601]|nr:formate hydrogenlyase maturation protein HycH [Tolypothrix sp. PCC 7601]